MYLLTQGQNPACVRRAASAFASKPFPSSRHVSSQSSSRDEGDPELRVIASLVLERLPVVLPELQPWAAKYKAFSFERQQQYRKQLPADFLAASASARDEDEGEAEFEPAPRVTPADEANDVRSLQRALDRRLYLLVHGAPASDPGSAHVWHFPERAHGQEVDLRKCAEGALQDNVGSAVDAYFVGNAPCGHLHLQDTKKFFFRAQILGGKLKLADRRLRDYAWVTKEEALQFLDPSHTQFFQDLLI